MSDQTTMTGPARLRFLAGNARIQGYKWLSGDLDELAALWEADLERATQKRVGISGERAGTGAGASSVSAWMD